MRGAAISGEGGRDSLPAAANKMKRGPREIEDFLGEGNMLPAIFLPIAYYPVLNLIQMLVGKL